MENATLPQRQTKRAWYQFLKLATIIFVLHLIPVIYILCLCMQYSEAVMGWYLFLMIDFPLGWLWFPVDGLLNVSGFFTWLEKVMDMDVMDIYILFFLPVFFQIIGTINWVIIVFVLRWSVRLLYTFISSVKKKLG